MSSGSDLTISKNFLPGTAILPSSATSHSMMVVSDTSRSFAVMWTFPFFASMRNVERMGREVLVGTTDEIPCIFRVSTF